MFRPNLDTFRGIFRLPAQNQHESIHKNDSCNVDTIQSFFLSCFLFQNKGLVLFHKIYQILPGFHKMSKLEQSNFFYCMVLIQIISFQTPETELLLMLFKTLLQKKIQLTWFYWFTPPLLSLNISCLVFSLLCQSRLILSSPPPPPHICWFINNSKVLFSTESQRLTTHLNTLTSFKTKIVLCC